VPIRTGSENVSKSTFVIEQILHKSPQLCDLVMSGALSLDHRHDRGGGDS
jgi:hypothetical protein